MPRRAPFTGITGEQFTHLVYNFRPDEIYHLGAQSLVKVSLEMPEDTGDIAGLGVTRLHEAR